MITMTSVPNNHINLMVSDGWKIFTRDTNSSVLFKNGDHKLINGLSEWVWHKIQRDIVKRNRFEVVK